MITWRFLFLNFKSSFKTEYELKNYFKERYRLMKLNNVMSELELKYDDALMKRTNAEKYLEHVQSRASQNTIFLGNVKL